MNRLVAHLLPSTRKTRIAAAYLMALLVMLFDVLSGSDLRVYPLYFVPLVVASTTLERPGAIGFAVLCTSLWFVSKLLDGTQFASYWVWAWNTIAQGISFVFVAILVSKLGTAMAREMESAAILNEQHAELSRRKLELEKLNNDLSNAIQSREDVERISRHDLKTPLASIVAACSLLREVPNVSTDDERLLGMIGIAASRALGMVNLSLNLRQMEAGQYDFKPSPVDLTQIVLAVANDLTLHASSKSVAIRFSGTEPHLFVDGEDLLCYSLIGNIMKNAVEAAPDNSAVLVSLEDGARTSLRIHNLGAVPAPMRDKFFHKYATYGKASGSGLGTYSAHLMAQAQGGSLTMASAVESGTTLTLEMNRAATPAAAKPDAIRKPAGVTGRICPQRVLIVDDEAYNQLILKRTLPSPPVVVDVAINGRNALEAVMRHRPDIVFMDIEMPIMGGIEALKKIREFQESAGQPPSFVIAYSANDDAASHALFAASGFDTSLGKPSSTRDILAMLKTTSDEAVLEDEPANTVLVSPDLLNQVPGFLETRMALIEQMRAALRDMDREGVRKIAHKLSGSFAVFGFAEAAALCKEIEASAATDEIQLLDGKAARLAQHVKTVDVRAAQ